MSISPTEHNLLRERYNPDGSPLRQYQLYLLEMLNDFDALCKKLGVEYWLSQGTVLGAVRHGGFIPWDDDIDVEMRQQDFVKLCKSFRETDRYALQTIFSDSSYPLPFAKFRDKKSIVVDSESKLTKQYRFQGAFIDIFYSEYRFEFISKVLNWLFQIAAKCASANNLISIRFARLFKYAGYFLCSIFRNILRIIPGKSYGLGYGSHFYFVKSDESDIFPLRQILFEGRYFPAPGRPENYLSIIYGDYMKIPQLNEIKTHLTDFTILK